MDLTEQDVNVIEQRLASNRMAAWANPPMPPVTGWNKELADMYQAGVARRRAAAEAEEERLRLERDAAAERQRVAWEKGAPARKAALEHAALLRPKLAEAQARLDAIEAEYYEAERRAG